MKNLPFIVLITTFLLIACGAPIATPVEEKMVKI